MEAYCTGTGLTLGYAGCGLDLRISQHCLFEYTGAKCPVSVDPYRKWIWSGAWWKN